MKNFARKLAYVLTFVMVLGVIAPVTTTVKAAEPVEADFNLGSETVEFTGGTGRYVVAEAKEDTKSTKADTAKDIYEVNKKFYKLSDIAEGEGEFDLSWANGKAVTVAYGYVKTNGDYVFTGVKDIAAQDKNFKAYFTGAKFADDADVKVGSATVKGSVVNAKLVWNTERPDAGYFYFVGTTSGSSVGVLDPSTVQWKKGANGRWSEEGEGQDTLADVLPKFMAKGTTLYFRKVASDDAWASKEVKVAYAKQAKATAVKVDVTKDEVALKNTMEYVITYTNETTEGYEWVSAKKAHGDANGKVSSVKLTDLYTDFSLVDKQGNAKTQRKLSSEDIANGDRVLVVRIAGTSKKIASKEYKIKLKAADQFTNANVGTTSASAIQVELTKNYDKTAGLTLTNNSAQNVEFKVVGVKKESEITKWSTLKAKSGTKAGTAKVKTGEYISSEKIASGAAIIFRYPGVKGTTTVTLAGISYSYDLTGIKETEQKVTTATAKSGDKSTVTLDAEKQEVTVVVAKKDVATGSAVKLTVDLKLSGIKEAPKGTVTGYGTTDPKGTVKFNKDGTASFVIDVKKGFEAGKTITYTVKTTKGNAAFTVVFKYGLE